MLRETDVKDICVAIAKDKIIRGTWSGEQKRKPHDRHGATPSDAQREGEGCNIIARLVLSPRDGRQKRLNVWEWIVCVSAHHCRRTKLDETRRAIFS
jgi:hypothetical protein